MKHSIFLALRSTVFAAGFLWLWAWIAEFLRVYDPLLGGPLPPWTAAAGLSILAAGSMLAFLCVATFVARGRGTPALFDPPRRFVAAGPYRYVRNPMYIGGAFMLLGLGMAQRSPAIVLFVPAWWLLFHLLVVFYEERTLHTKFGDDYDRYRRATPRWIPRVTHAALAALVLIPAPLLDAAKSTAKWDCRIGGSPCAVAIPSIDLRLDTRANWDGAELVIQSEGEYNGGKLRISDRWTLSPDRRTLTFELQ